MLVTGPLLKAHLHYIRDLGPSIRVRARTQSKQVNWCFVFTLIRVRVRDFCLGRPCPSSSLHVAISSDTDVRGCAIRMLKAAWARGRYCRLPKWPWPRITSDPSLGCSVNKTRSGARTRMLGQCKCKCALTWYRTISFAKIKIKVWTITHFLHKKRHQDITYGLFVSS